ncbi:MAG: thioredoxin family protein [Limisphaerales bacterium]
MKIILCILLLFVATSVVVRAGVPDGWSTNYPATLSVAESAHHPILVYFTASWCGPCKLMSQITLTDPTILQTISGMEHVAVDIDQHPDIATKHRIKAVPTFVMLSTADDEVERTTGFQAAADFLQWLTNSFVNAKQVAVQQALAQKTLAEVDKLLDSQATNAVHLAAVKLFDLCGEHDAMIVKAATERLKIIADRDPAALLDGLNDSRLAVRIQFANTLHSKIGNAFDFDPWSDAATREKKILGLCNTFTK